MSDEITKCEICKQPMPKGEEKFSHHAFHGNDNTCPSEPKPEIDAANKFLVSLNGNSLAILNPRGTLSHPTQPIRLSYDDALLLAAWLVTLAEYDAKNTFEDVLAAVQGT